MYKRQEEACEVFCLEPLYGAETKTLRKDEDRELQAFEMSTWRRIERVPWKDRVTNE